MGIYDSLSEKELLIKILEILDEIKNKNFLVQTYPIHSFQPHFPSEPYPYNVMGGISEPIV